MAESNYAALDAELSQLLKLSVPAIGIAFCKQAPAGVAPIDRALPPPTADGRTGTAAAGCVFWIEATQREFVTVASDHGNCSVGSLTHGFKSLNEVAGNADIAALVAAEWVSPKDFGGIPTIKDKPGAVVYGPLSRMSTEPDIVFLRLNGKQLMQLHCAVPDIDFQGKPQCHIIPLAKETGDVAVSSGCMLSRVRTGMSNNEVTCAIPARRLGEIVAKLKVTQAADLAVAAYASEDAKRFG
jgi:uncharacterized protein (DUF169 family)